MKFNRFEFRIWHLLWIFKKIQEFWNLKDFVECPRGVMVKAIDCRIIVSEFEFQSCYYVHFRTNTLGKGINPPYPPIYGLNSIPAVLLEGWLWHWITNKGWYAIKQRNQTKPKILTQNKKYGSSLLKSTFILKKKLHWGTVYEYHIGFWFR